MDDVKRVLEILRELATIDSNIEKIEQSILTGSEGLTPILEEMGKSLSLKEILEKLEERKNSFQERIDSLTSEIEEKEKQIREMEEDIEKKRDLMNKSNEYLNQARHNEEYLKMVSAINEATKNIAKNEMAINSLQGELKKLRGKLESIKKKREEQVPILDERIEIIKKCLSEMDSKKSKYIKRREELLAQLPPDLSARYERVKKIRGSAVALIDDKVCTGCFSVIPHQRFAIVKRETTLITCEQCGRFLIWKKE